MWQIGEFRFYRTISAVRIWSRAAWQRIAHYFRRHVDHTVVITRTDAADRPPALHWTPCHPTTRARFKASMACSSGHVLTLRAHRIAPDGRVAPSVVCPMHGCAFHAYVRLEDWSFGAVQ